ncbi:MULTISPECIES: NAD(P)/FAD-dependent oxidoreductase [unclassified Mycolicibacterium]|uniref:FAD-dependent oxidoreductase n=1 Tax=unclassified Mycolicibacterium TaxID=2636767 RepID=UPI0012DE12BA|nr:MULTISPECIES: FAD-dependent monooxygenase [unclassified Mycolicibacterium]MUL82014.1 FAD-dependent oxidoreductase [Mycolicibacterium sp. CBMA 329]MUL87780.1 FAD-dependent oxidoreductase [Mycolicibacterium sp. CBMA 331]MUM01604.1 FAD-dependent oxidoreductase [Mycolicibacterium sp. CBMA 334]MUM27272.1 FAD-dependent oxidoreductase [Mycolicibacterium sp. CBMA 295]MUM38077.1 FAD-dependent oxidoreductase [Mycolicibacterium sp. CBMA 247]
MNDHAVVLGAGIAGLIAATVLAEQYGSVTVVERDRLPDTPISRRGVPQGRHLHSLLSRGSQIMEELLPGFLADLADAGALVLDDADMHRIYSRMGPYTFNRTAPAADPAALVTYLVSRPFLEFHLRQRVSALPNVTFLDGRDVGELIARQPGWITGVRVTARDSGSSETLRADLIVDATGRATRTPLLLEQLGYPRPPEKTFTADGIYHSQQVAIAEQDSFPERLILVLPEGKAQRGGLVACENSTWTLTIAGRTADLAHTPRDFADMLTLAQDFIPPHIQPALDHAQPLTEVLTYRYPGGVWRRYDQMTRYPKGLLVLGDALCSLDPINGQGMTMATLHAMTLRTQLRHANPIDPQAFYAALTAIIKPTWASNAHPPSNGADKAPATVAQRTLGWARRKILESAADDMIVTEQLMRVANFVDPPKRLVEPGFLARVAAHHIRQGLTMHRDTRSINH